MFYTLYEEAKPSAYWNDEKLCFDSQYGSIFHILLNIRRRLRSIEPFRQWVPGVKPYMRDAAQPRPCNAEIKNTWCYTSTLQYTFILSTMSNCPPLHDIQNWPNDSEKNCEEIM
jgi:hypothetical protein